MELLISTGPSTVVIPENATVRVRLGGSGSEPSTTVPRKGCSGGVVEGVDAVPGTVVVVAGVLVVVVGAEGAGLSRLARARCDLVVSIPMRGRLGSLNVSAAGAVLMYAILQKRLDAST